MGVVAWYFVEDADGRMVRTPRARVDRFLDGDEVLPSASGTHVRAAEVFVQVEGRTVTRVHRVLWPKWAITADGRCDPDARTAYRRLAVQMVAVAPVVEPVVPLGPALAKRDIGQDHQWQPGPAQLQEVASAVNLASADPPVVVTHADHLEPL